jgi:hypothetical protein
MLRHLILSIVVFFSFLGKSNAQLNNPLKITVHDAPYILDTSITFKPDASFPDYHFALHFSTDAQNHFVITRSNDSCHCLDTIAKNDCMYDHQWYPDENVEIVKFMDVNMDGFDDIFVLDGIPEIAGYPRYNVWLFDPKTEMYFLNEEFSEHISPECDFDETNKIIKTNRLFYFRDPFEYSYYTYKLSGNHLVLIESIDQHIVDEQAIDISERRFIWERKKLIQGKLVVVERNIKNWEQVLKEQDD